MTLRIVESPMRVPGIPCDLRTRYEWRARRRCTKLNALRIIPSYRWEVVWDRGRWEVVAFQNYAR